MCCGSHPRPNMRVFQLGAERERLAAQFYHIKNKVDVLGRARPLHLSQDSTAGSTRSSGRRSPRHCDRPECRRMVPRPRIRHRETAKPARQLAKGNRYRQVGQYPPDNGLWDAWGSRHAAGKLETDTQLVKCSEIPGRLLSSKILHLRARSAHFRAFRKELRLLKNS